MGIKAKNFYLETFNDRNLELTRISSDKSLKSAEKKLCEMNPCYFIGRWHTIASVEGSDLGYIPFFPWDFQENFIMELEKRVRSKENVPTPYFVRKSRQIGMTETIISFMCWAMIFIPNFMGILMSRKKDEVFSAATFSLFGKIELAFSYYPKFFGFELDKNQPNIKNLKNGSMIRGSAPIYDAGRGMNVHVSLIDEVDYLLNKGQQETIFTGLSGATRKAVIFSSTVARKGSFFERNTDPEKKPELESLKRVNLKWDVHPERDDEWREKMIASIGTRQFSKDYEAKAILNEGRVFEKSWEDISRIDFGNPAFKEKMKNDIDSGKAIPVGAMDFGTGESLLVAILGIYFVKTSVLILIGEEYGKRVSCKEFSDRIKRLQISLGFKFLIVGDPTSKSKESDQKNWEIRLQEQGILYSALPYRVHQQVYMSVSFQNIDEMIEKDRLQISDESDLSYLSDCVDFWESSSKGKPEGGYFSHGGMALTYLVMAIREGYFST